MAVHRRQLSFEPSVLKHNDIVDQMLVLDKRPKQP